IVWETSKLFGSSGADCGASPCVLAQPLNTIATAMMAPAAVVPRVFMVCSLPWLTMPRQLYLQKNSPAARHAIRARRVFQHAAEEILQLPRLRLGKSLQETIQHPHRATAHAGHGRSALLRQLKIDEAAVFRVTATT